MSYNLFMLLFLLKLFLAIIAWAALAIVILFVPYPKSLSQASPMQLLAFFIPLSFALPFTIDLILSFPPHSILISFGLIILFVLKGLNALNLASAGLTILAIILLMNYFKRSKHLTSEGKIPRLKGFRR